MTLATRPLRIRLQTPAGAALAGAKVTLQLSAYQVDGTDIVPLARDAIEDPAKVGDYILDVWPNTRGDGGTHYDTLVQANGQVLLRQVITVTAGAGEAMVAAKINAAPWPPLYEASSEVQAARLFSEASGSSAGIALAARGQVEAIAQQFGDVSTAVEVVTEKREEVVELTEATQAASASAAEALQTVWALARLAGSGAEGIGYSAATSGPDAYFAIRRGGVAMDGATVLGRTTCFRRTGPATAVAFASLLDAGEFDDIIQPVDRPDVAILFGKVGEPSPGYVDPFALWHIDTIGKHIGDVEGNATGIDGPEWGVRLLNRPDAALAVIDPAGRGGVVMDVFGEYPSATGGAAVEQPLPWPRSNDRVLADLKKVGAAYKGDFVSGTKYRAWDVVADPLGKLYLYTTTSGGAAASPGVDPTCVYLPLYERTCYAVADEFDNAPGPANNRYSPQGYQWVVGGAGYANATVAGGVMTSALNTYFQLRGLQGKVVEVDTEYSCSDLSITHTIALSPNNLATVDGVPFGEMWHVNWQNTGVGLVTYWHAGLIGAQATLALQWSAGKVMQQNVQHRCTLAFRGKVCFGYLDGEIAFIHVHDFIETMCSNANAMYVQNHYATAGVEKQYAVRVKVAEGPDWGRIAINAADPMSPLLLTAEGSPEGLVQAPCGSKVFSKSGPEYRKTTATGMTGWA